MQNHKFGLLGFPLGHSFSKTYFTQLFEQNEWTDCSYHNFEIADISQFRDFIASQPEIEGFNVTIPHKKRVMEMLDTVDCVAQSVGAVNCVTVERKGDNMMLKGYNTDVYGFEVSLLELIGEARPNALVLGTGGAAAAVCWVLRKLEISYISVSHSGAKDAISYDDITPKILKGRLIINTTPLGMYPSTETFPPIDYSCLDANNYLYDLVYNPTPTRFMEQGIGQGAKSMGGLKMLILQAEKAWEYFSHEE